MRLLVLSGAITMTCIGATLWLAWEARRTERQIARGFKWDSAAREAGFAL